MGSLSVILFKISPLSELWDLDSSNWLNRLTDTVFGQASRCSPDCLACEIPTLASQYPVHFHKFPHLFQSVPGKNEACFFPNSLIFSEVRLSVKQSH